MRLRISAVVVVGLAGILLSGICLAQDSGVNLALHANSHATAADIGLPVYPGATLYKNPDSKGDDSAANIGFTFGDFHFSVLAVSYVSSDSPEKVLAYYRKPLSKYGDVLECDHGKPVGKLTVASSGLTCSDQHGGHVQVNGSANSSNDHELRAGSPQKFRVVGIDDAKAGMTHFGLVYLELPKDKQAQ